MNIPFFSGVKITATRERSQQLAQCFEMKGKICYCKDIPHLFAVMKEVFNPNEFTDGSKTSIKTVLLHIGNQKPSIPIAFAIGMKEEYNTMQDILKLIS